MTMAPTQLAYNWPPRDPTPAEAAVEDVLDLLRLAVSPFGVSITARFADPTTAGNPSVEFRFRFEVYDRKRRVNEPPHPLTGRELAWQHELPIRHLIEMSDGQREQFARHAAARFFSQAVEALVYRPAPPAPEPPDWRPAETTPEDFYTT